MFDIPQRWTVGDFEVRPDELSSVLSAGDAAQLQRWYPRDEGWKGSDTLPTHPKEKPVPPDAVLWYVLVGLVGAVGLSVLANVAASSVFAYRARVAVRKIL